MSMYKCLLKMGLPAIHLSLGYFEFIVCTLKQKCQIKPFFKLWLKPWIFFSSTILIWIVYYRFTDMAGVYHETDCYNVMLDFIFIHLSARWILSRKDVYWYIVKNINKAFTSKYRITGSSQRFKDYTKYTPTLVYEG